VKYVEIFRISIRVTSTSINQHEQGFRIIKESIEAVSIFNNKQLKGTPPCNFQKVDAASMGLKH
jgi:hypothetical protein